MKASAPGSLMLLGEHAVLHGRRALVCAIDRRITVSAFRTREESVKIFSDLGTYDAPLAALKDHPDFRFVLDAVRQYPLKRGIELRIESEFSSDVGFGSSAAVTAAVHAVLMGTVNDRMELFKRSLETVRRVQGRGSGADVAASVFGGVMAYRAEPLEIHPIPETFPLTAVYSGSKMKTAEVITRVEMARALDPEKVEHIFDEMDRSVGEVMASFPNLGKMLCKNQKLMEELGLCNAALGEIVNAFRRVKIPAKISGSGLGDCAIGLGEFPHAGLGFSGEGPASDTPEQQSRDEAVFPTYPLRVSHTGACL
jgi:mevalonate kinase